MATVRTMSSAAKLLNLKNAILPVTLKLSPVYLKQPIIQTNVPVRWTSYTRSGNMDSRPVQTEVEVVNDPEAWSIVEQLMKENLVPVPKPKEQYPSGWKPPNPSLNADLPYFIPRNSNHMHNVHMKFDRKNSRRLTTVRKIQGDIWQLEKELTAYLEKVEQKYVSCFINEAYGKLIYRGDYVNNIIVFLEKRGF